MQRGFNSGEDCNGTVGVSDPPTFAPDLRASLMALADALDVMEAPERADVEAVVLHLGSIPHENLDGVVWLLRATATPDAIGLLDREAVWPLMVGALSRDGSSAYGSVESARRDFEDASQANLPFLSPTRAGDEAAVAASDVMLVGAGIRRTRMGDDGDLRPWRRIIRRAVGLPRSRAAAYRRTPRRRRARRDSSQRRATARSPGRPGRAEPSDAESEPPSASEDAPARSDP